MQQFDFDFRFLLRKILQFQSNSDPSLAGLKIPGVGHNTTALKVMPTLTPVPQEPPEPVPTTTTAVTKPKIKKKVTERRKTVTELLGLLSLDFYFDLLN